MELLRGGKGAPAAPTRNLAIKNVVCSCGCNTFICFPVGIVGYNVLNPQEAAPQVFGHELKCKNCGLWQVLKHGEQGELPKWVSISTEDKEQADRDAFKAAQEKAKA